MIKKFLQNRKEMAELKKAKKYYYYLKAGALFLEFIYQDLEKQKKDNCNRHQRRAFEAHMEKTGRLSDDMVRYYSTKIDNVLKFVEANENRRTLRTRLRLWLNKLQAKLAPKNVNPMAQPCCADKACDKTK